MFVGGGLLLGRIRGWFLIIAVAVCLILFAGLVHDFMLPDQQAGWLTSHPALAGILLTIGYLAMVANRLVRRRGEEEQG